MDKYMDKYILPILFIEWLEKGEKRSAGPFYTISPDGGGTTFGRKWIAYSVQTKETVFTRITVPYYHTIIAKNIL